MIQNEHEKYQYFGISLVDGHGSQSSFNDVQTVRSVSYCLLTNVDGPTVRKFEVEMISIESNTKRFSIVKTERSDAVRVSA